MTDDTSLKTARPQPAGGSGKQTASLVPGAGEDFDKKLVAYKQRMKTHTDAIKRHLAQFIERTISPADDTCVTAALLELGIERRLDLLGEEDARDLTERTFRRVVKQRRGTSH
jgi:hypothetical protein